MKFVSLNCVQNASNHSLNLICVFFFHSFLFQVPLCLIARLKNVCLPSIEVFSLKVKCKASFAKHKPKYNHWGLHFLKFNFKISFYLFVFELVIYIS